MVVAGDSSGTGFLIDRERRLLVTNYHVVGEEQTARVVFPFYLRGKPIKDREFYHKDLQKRSISARVLKRDATHDLAVLQLARLPRGVEALSPVAESAAAGQVVYRLASPAPAGEAWKLTATTVLTVGPRTLTYRNVKQKVEAVILTSEGPNRPGESGGPVVNDKGELVAVNAAVLEKENKSFAIDVRELKKFLRGVIKPEKEPSEDE
jgi:S1-C subfamily serine protease